MRWLGQSTGGFLRRNGKKRVPGILFPTCTVEGVRARFKGQIRNRAPAPSVLGRVTVPQHRNFADRFLIGGLEGLSADSVIVVVKTVNQEIVGPGAQTI